MALAERPQPGWASCHNPNTNSCQDMSSSILLLLGLVICVNIGISMVTLLWSRLQLRVVLSRIFHSTCEKEAAKVASPGKLPSKEQTCPQVHLRCTMDPVKMTVTPPPTRRRRRRDSLTRRHRLRCAQRPGPWAPDPDDERLPRQHPAVCSQHSNGPVDWDKVQPVQQVWIPWTQDAPKPHPQIVHFQPTVEGKPLKLEVPSDLELQAYVYTVNPPPPSPEALCHNNNGVGGGAGAAGEEAQCLPAPLIFLGPATVPEIPWFPSSRRITYDARDIRRRLRELTREVEALSRCYPLASGSSTAEGTSKDWVYRPLKGR